MLPNYFELFGLEPMLNIDEASLKKTFYQLSREWHPDRYINADAAAATKAMQMTAQINEAYNTLKNSEHLLAYVLRVEGLLQEDEKYTLPSAFLMQMMDLNELVSEAEEQPEDSIAKAAAMATLQDELDNWQRAYEKLVNQFSEGNRNHQLYSQLKDMLFRKRYLQRIAERLFKK